MMAVTLKDIYVKLEQMERAIKFLVLEETEALTQEKSIKMGENQVLSLLNKQVSLLFDNIVDWKKYIWDNCPFRKTNEGGKTIDFVCMKTKNKCRYTDCFRNRR
jgi:hypothetical protein